MKFYKNSSECIQYNNLKLSAECSEECRSDCSFKYFTWDLHQEERYADWQEPLIINIKHSRFPDIIVRYSPQITFISFVCNFGGLLCMWLGLSVLAFF